MALCGPAELLGGRISADVEMRNVDATPTARVRTALHNISLQAAQQATIGLRKIPGNNKHCVVLSSDIREASFVAQTLSSQHVCNRGGFFCLQISSDSRIMRAKGLEFLCVCDCVVKT